MVKIHTLTKKHILLGITAVLLSVILFWIIFGGEPVTAYVIKKTSALQGVTVTGTVEARQDAKIAPTITAVIKEILVSEGDYVKKGQILAKLDDTVVKGEYTQAEWLFQKTQYDLENLLSEPRKQRVNIAKAKITEIENNIKTQAQEVERKKYVLADTISTEKRLKILYKEGAISYSNYEAARFLRLESQESLDFTQGNIKELKQRLIQAQQELSLIAEGTKKEEIAAAMAAVKAESGKLQSAKAILDKYTVKALFDGYVSRIILKKGSVTSPNDPIFSFITPSNLEIFADVEENQIEKIKSGQQALIVPDAYPDDIFKSKIITVIKDVNPITGTFRVETSIPYKEGKPLIPGMTSDVTIIVDSLENAVIIPLEFITKEDGKEFVYLKKNGFTKMISIKTKNFDNDRVRVLKGPNEGDIIVKTESKKKLKHKQKVRIKKYYEFNNGK
jgi:HlyD family secretion protein